MNRTTRKTVLVGALFVTVATSAQAAFYKDLAVGLSLFDFQFSGEKNLLGNGFTANATAFYNNRRFDFGVADLTLNGLLSMSVGVTKRGIPDVEFRMNTGGSPLNYTFNINNGIQDLTATGNALINISTDINALGFYDQTIQISNRGNYATDGFVLVDSGTLDFDAGPIDIHGNVFADALAALTEPFFAATNTINPFAKFSGKATKAIEAERKADELRARLDAGEVLSDDEIASLINNTILAAVLGGNPDTSVLDNLPVIAGDKDVLTDSTRLVIGESVPEPSSLILLAAAAAPLVARRRRNH